MTKPEFEQKLRELSKWLWENDLQISGCGCCGSPTVEATTRWTPDTCADCFNQYDYYDPGKGIGVSVEMDLKLKMQRSEDEV